MDFTAGIEILQTYFPKKKSVGQYSAANKLELDTWDWMRSRVDGFDDS